LRVRKTVSLEKNIRIQGENKKKKKRERENIVLKKNHQSSLTPLVSSMEQKQE
jgi:hypothetical protein